MPVPGRLLSPAGSGPIRHPRQIVVIHDAGIPNAPAGYARSYRVAHKLMDALLARSARIATVSHFSRMELASFLGIPAEEILLAPNGTPITSNRLCRILLSFRSPETPDGKVLCDSWTL